MKSIIKKVGLYLGLIICLTTPKNLFAQEFDFAQILKAPQQDIETYLTSYIGPGMISFANGMAGGWYNTAKTHKPLGFDITGAISIAPVPNGERQFSFNQSDYLALTATQGLRLPTLVGGGKDDFTGALSIPAQFSFQADGTTYTYENELTFDAPFGYDPKDGPIPIAGVPVPSLQLGIGLIKNTDLKIRYGFYNNEEDGIDINLIGFGIMHDIKQWIPGIKQIPIDISIFFGTTKLTAEAKIDESDSDFRALGKAEFESRATTYQLLISKKLSFFTPYFGIGVNSVSSSLKITGDYTLFEVRDLNNTPYTFQNPVDLAFEDGGGLRSTVGFRLKLAVITLHADYTIQKSNILSVGAGISIR